MRAGFGGSGINCASTVPCAPSNVAVPAVGGSFRFPIVQCLDASSRSTRPTNADHFVSGNVVVPFGSENVKTNLLFAPLNWKPALVTTPRGWHLGVVRRTSVSVSETNPDTTSDATAELVERVGGVVVFALGTVVTGRIGAAFEAPTFPNASPSDPKNVISSTCVFIIFSHQAACSDLIVSVDGPGLTHGRLHRGKRYRSARCAPRRTRLDGQSVVVEWHDERALGPVTFDVDESLDGKDAIGARDNADRPGREAIAREYPNYYGISATRNPLESNRLPERSGYPDKYG